MFTGIIETLGKVVSITQNGRNRQFEIQSPISGELKVDQSVSHDGVCLTVVEVGNDHHVVTAVDETLERSNLGHWEEGQTVNLERAMSASGRFDGHIVQGHVDATALCDGFKDQEGSWLFAFELQEPHGGLLVDKGSICINGVSLTCFNVQESSFQVAIIPYTFENTSFSSVGSGDLVNLEFDIVGKYVRSILKG